MRRISTATVHSQVYDQLRNAIMAGQFRPGEAVTIRDLAQTFAVSNTPVREALRRLIAEHALESLPNRCVRVPVITRRDVENILQARVLVEGESAFLAAQKCTARLVQKLEKIKAEEIKLANSGDTARLKQNNQRFHFTLYEGCGNPVLISLIQPLWMRYASLFRIKPLLVDYNVKFGCFPRHSEVLRALKKEDAEAVKHAVVSDITDGTKAKGFWEQVPA